MIDHYCIHFLPPEGVDLRDRRVVERHSNIYIYIYIYIHDLASLMSNLVLRGRIYMGTKSDKGSVAKRLNNNKKKYIDW